MMLAVPTDLRSTGQLVVDLHASHGALLRVILDLCLEPSLVLNGVHYYDAASQARIAAALNGQAADPRSDSAAKRAANHTADGGCDV